MRAISRLPEEELALANAEARFLHDMLTDFAFMAHGARGEIGDVFGRLIAEEVAHASYRVREVTVRYLE